MDPIYLIFVYFFCFKTVKTNTLSSQIELISSESACYKVASESETYFAIRFNKRINPPLLMEIYFGKIIFDGTKRTEGPTYRLFLLLTHELCTTTFPISSIHYPFTQIIYHFKIHIGRNNTNKFSDMYFIIYPNTESGLYSIFDAYNKFLFLFSFDNKKENLPVLKVISRVEQVESVKLIDFNTEYICISDKFNIFVIKAEFESRQKTFPIYNVLNIRLYSNNEPLYVMSISAWPCEYGVYIFDLHDPIIVIENDIKNPAIYWTFSEFGVYEDPPTISLEKLQSGVYFETYNPIESIKFRDNWLLSKDRLFVVKQQRYDLICEGDYTLTGIKLMIGDNDLMLYKYMRRIQTTKNYAFINFTRIENNENCDVKSLLHYETHIESI